MKKNTIGRQKQTLVEGLKNNNKEQIKNIYEDRLETLLLLIRKIIY